MFRAHQDEAQVFVGVEKYHEITFCIDILLFSKMFGMSSCCSPYGAQTVLVQESTVLQFTELVKDLYQP